MIDFRSALDEILAIDSAASAIEYLKSWHTWGDLSRCKEAIDAVLLRLGMDEGAAIGVVLRNHPPSVAALLSVVFGNRCLVTLNPMLPPNKLHEDIRMVRVPVLIAEAEDWNRHSLGELVQNSGITGIVLTGDRTTPVSLLSGTPHATLGDPHPLVPGIAVEIQTSGTTGTPKRVALKFASVTAALTAAMVYEKDRKPGDPMKLRSGVVISHTSPVHTLGLWGILTAIFSGRRLCLLDKFAVPEWLDAVQRHRTAVASVPPAGLRMILDLHPTKEQMGRLVALRSGTAPLDPAITDEFLERYDIAVLENYGATEFAGGVAGWTLEDFRRCWRAKRGAVGQLHEGVEARVVDPASFEVLPLGAEGLLELRAGQFLNGGEWIRTTDCAVLDSDRFLWIKGRSDNAIIRGGFKIHPDDVVSALERHAAVREACVVGVPDRRLGQVPVAALTLKSGFSPPTHEELDGFLRETLTAYQIPIAFKVFDELPRTPSMKISQPAVRELFASDASDVQSRGVEDYS